MEKLIVGMLVVFLTASFNHPAAAAKANAKAKREACLAAANASCWPNCSVEVVKSYVANCTKQK